MEHKTKNDDLSFTSLKSPSNTTQKKAPYLSLALSLSITVISLFGFNNAFAGGTGGNGGNGGGAPGGVGGGIGQTGAIGFYFPPTGGGGGGGGGNNFSLPTPVAGSGGGGGGGAFGGPGGAVGGGNGFPGGIGIGGGGGGAGGGGNTTVFNSGTINTNVLGGFGGFGGFGGDNIGASGSGGGAGGGGGDGALTSSGITIAPTVTVQGGNGGDGGKGGNVLGTPTGTGGSGGGGGGGGAGLFINAPDILTTPNLNLTNNGTLLGGNGGNGGNGGSALIAGARGGGGGGGAGLFFNAAGYTFTNTGIITGGNGGANSTTGTGDGGSGGTGTGGATGGTGLSIISLGGVGSVGASGGSTTFINSGAITGGLMGDGITRTRAMTFPGNNNTLEIQNGSIITGNVICSGLITNNTLTLGGSGEITFDVSKIGTITLLGGVDYQYQGFTLFNKTGTSTWTLTNTPAQLTPWTISDGTLSVSNDNNLGASGGALTFNGGTLQVTGTTMTSTSRVVTLGNNGGGFNIADPANTFNLTQSLSGGGSLRKFGTGKLLLNGSNTFTGPTTIFAGTLQTGIANALDATTAVTLANTGFSLGIAPPIIFNLNNFNQSIGSLSGGEAGGSVTLGTATLATGHDDTNTTFFGVISGAGGITKVGSGAFTLSATNTFTGPTKIFGGTLQAGIANALSTSTAVTLGSAQILANASGVVFNLNNLNQSIGSLSDGGTTGGNVILGSATLTTGNDNTSTSFSGIISGTGKVIKTGTGEFTLSGPNTYTGPTTINGGTVKAGIANTLSSSTAVTLANTPGVAFNLNNFNQSIGSLSGGGPVGGDVALGSAILTTGNDNTNTSFSGGISGTGGLKKVGTGVFTVNGTKTYTGPTTIAAGTMTVNGTLSSDVTIAQGATLNGNATVNSLTSSGTINPGSSIGTINVKGNLTLMPTSLYNYEISPTGQSDSLNVTGTASLNGTLNVIPELGSYTPGALYTVLSALGGVSGQFSSVTQTATLSFKILYQPNQVLLQIFQQSFAQTIDLVGQSPNASNLANYLDMIAPQALSGSDMARILQILNTLPNEAVLTNALEQIQPGPTVEAEEVASDVVTLFINAINNELNNLRASKTLNNAFSNIQGIKPSLMSDFIQHVTSHNPQNISNQFKQLLTSTRKNHHQVNTLNTLTPSQRQLPQDVRVKVGKATFWAQQANQFLKFNDHGKYRLVGIKSQTAAFIVGADYLFSDSLVLGLVGSYGNTQFDWKRNRGHGKSSSYNMGVYGSWTSPTALYLDFSGLFGRHHLHSHRHISFPGVVRTAKGSHWDTGATGSLEVGYIASLPCNYSLQPFANATYSLLHQPTYREKGAGALNMKIREKTRHYNDGGVGLEFARLFTYTTTSSIMRPSIRLGYQTLNALGKSDRLQASLVGFGGQFGVKGSRKHRHFFNVGASIAALSNEKIYLMMTYNGNFNKRDQVQEGLFRIGWKI